MFVPLGLLQGVVGQFFAALSTTLAAAVLLSLAYALLFIPGVAGRVLRAHDRPHADLGWLSRGYRGVLTWSLKRPALVVGFTLAFAALGVVLFSRLETGFLPEMDEGGYIVDYWTPEGTSLPETDRMLKRVERGLGSGIADVKTALAAETWPIGYSWRLGGQYESQQSSFRSMLLVLSVAVLLVFGVLVAQFRRFVPSLIILSAAPLSLVGAFGLLIIAGTPLNVSSMMGLILLIGLIVKNGIILVDYAQIVTERGAETADALVEAGTVRLRPILMTTLCTLFGLLPLALGLGPGAEMQKPLAIAVIGGLSVSTVITLIFVPTALSIVKAKRG